MHTRILITALGWLALAPPGAAQDEVADPSAEDVAQPPAGERVEGDGDESVEETDIDEFIFSEEIPADTQLVFPVDI